MKRLFFSLIIGLLLSVWGKHFNWELFGMGVIGSLVLIALFNPKDEDLHL